MKKILPLLIILVILGITAVIFVSMAKNGEYNDKELTDMRNECVSFANIANTYTQMSKDMKR